MKSDGRLFSGLVARLAQPVRAAAAWRWASPLARAAAAVLGLVVLAAIGRSALAGGASKPQDFAAEGRAPDALAQSPPAQAATTPTGTPQAGGPVPELPPSSPPPIAAVLDAGEAPSRGRATPDDPVFLNQATLADLRRLPGVGDKRAKAILALRDRLQQFRQIEDLLKVKGIGRASLKKLRPLVRLDLLALPSPAARDSPRPDVDGGVT